MKLYYSSQTRAFRPRWLLEELEIPYEIVRINLAEKEHKSPGYLSVHPLGLLPALQDGPLTLLETGAICLYLADKYAQKGLAPRFDSLERALYYQWFFFAATTLEEPLLGSFMAERRGMSCTDEDKAKRKASALAALEVVSQTVTTQEYILPTGFSAADIAFGSLLQVATLNGLIEKDSALAQYRDRLHQRAAYKRARTEPT